MTRTYVWCEGRIIEELRINANFWVNSINFFLIQLDKQGQRNHSAAASELSAARHVLRIMYIMLNRMKG